MIKRTKYSRLCSIVLSISLASAVSGGCTSTPSMGERMMASSRESGEFATHWNEGESLYKEGKKLVSDGKKRIKDGEKLIDEGQDKISDGESSVERGNQLIKRGQDQMTRAEQAYAKKHPEGYRDMQGKR